MADGGSGLFKVREYEKPHCKHRDLTKEELTEVTISGPDGRMLTVADLEAVSDERAVPMVAVLTHQPYSIQLA